MSKVQYCYTVSFLSTGYGYSSNSSFETRFETLQSLSAISVWQLTITPPSSWKFAVAIGIESA